MCFSNFLAALRCANAASMLTDYDNQHKSIAEIAFESGFTSIRNFNRTFKKFHGITPRELKNAKLKTRS
jgi:AraC-like DNA-binding protein